MAIVSTLLISLLVLVCLLMTLIILMQRPKQEGLGAAFGGGMTDSMFGAQTTDVLQKSTTYLAVAFFVICIALAAIKTRQYEANASKGEGMIEATDPLIDPIPQIPDLSASAVDPLIPLPGGNDAADSTPAEKAAPTVPAETLPPALGQDDAKAAADAKPTPAPEKPNTPAPAPAAPATPDTPMPEAKPEAAKPAPVVPAPAPAEAPTTDQ